MRIFSGLQKWGLARLPQAGTTRREITVAFLFLVLLLFVGSLGYVLLEQWEWIDGLYMTFITLTTIGFTEIRTLSNAGRLFTIFIALLGIGTVTFIATRSAQLLITQRFRERRISRIISRMEDHYIICGYGRVGQRIAQDLERNGMPFVIIELDDERAEELYTDEAPYVHGDARDDEVLKEAGIDRASGLIITLPEDSANVFVTLTARELARESNPDLLITVRANDHDNFSKMRTAGADKVIAPIEVGADRMAQVVVRPRVDQFMEEVLRTGALGLQMEEVEVQAGSPLAGKSLSENNFHHQFDVIVVAIIDPESDEMQFNPSAKTEVKAGNILVVLGSQEMIKRLRKEGCTSS